MTYEEIPDTKIENDSDQSKEASLEGKYEFTEVEKARIRALNDTLRVSFIGGQVVVSASISEYDAADQAQIFQMVQQFDEFTEDNDPHKEHDFGIVKFRGESIYWKMDYYDLALEYHSPDKSDPSVTKRVLTIYPARDH